MKKTLLCVMMALIGMSFTANAEINIEGTYNGTLGVSIGGDNQSQGSDVQLINQTGDLYTLQIENLTLNNLPIVGTVTIPLIQYTDVEAAEEGSSVTLTGDVQAGPTVLEQTTTIKLTSGSVENEEMDLALTIQVTGMGEVFVTFTGTLDNGTGLIAVASNKGSLKITSVTKDDIQVEGVTTGAYTIYNAIGAVVKAGKLDGSQINVSALSTGTYVLMVEGASAKFIKQ